MLNAETYSQERNAMVESQIRARGVTDPRLLEVMRKTPRHCFVPEEAQAHAYEDRPLNIGSSQTISQPYMVAVMTDLLDVRPGHRVLEIGTGSGYQAAILAALASEVVTVERHEDLAEQAAERFRELGINNVRVLVGDGSGGAPKYAPYDRILVTAASPRTPGPLKEQLNVPGRLLCPVGSREAQKLVIVDRLPDGLEERESVGCVFVPLVGREGWREDSE